MAAIAEFTISVDSFPFETLLTALPDVEIELVQVVPMGERIAPYARLTGDRADLTDQFRTLVEEEPEIVSVRNVGEINGGLLVRIEWSTASRRLVAALAETEVTVLTARGSIDGWTFQVLAEDREDLADFKRRSRAFDCPVQLSTLGAVSALSGVDEYDLTEAQREALELAFERGYFDSPRRASLEEIATELDITRQSLASRLRRGHKRLLASTLIDP